MITNASTFCDTRVKCNNNLLPKSIKQVHSNSIFFVKLITKVPTYNLYTNKLV